MSRAVGQVGYGAGIAAVASAVVTLFMLMLAIVLRRRDVAASAAGWATSPPFWRLRRGRPES